MALQVGELYATFALNTAAFTSALNGLNSEISSSQELAKLGATFTAAITTPLAKAMKNILTTGMDFDAAMSMVYAYRGMTKEVEEDAAAMEALRNEAIRVAAQTKFTTEEAAEGLKYMALAGWDTESMLAGLEPIMHLAAAAEEDLGRVSDIVTDAITAFGLEAEDVTRFVDVLAAASTNANTTVDMLGESFKFAAPLAGAVGYSVEDFALALGLMANAGVKSGRAGRAINNMLAQMANPSDSAFTVMEELGLSLSDTEGNMYSFLEIMQQFREGFSFLRDKDIDLEGFVESLDWLEGLYWDSWGDIRGEELFSDLTDYIYSGAFDVETAMSKVLADLGKKDFTEQYRSLFEHAARLHVSGGLESVLQYASILGGRQAMPALLAIINATEDDFNSLAEAIYNSDGAAAKMEATTLDNLKGDITILQSTIDSLKVSISDLVNDGFREIVQGATDFIRSINAMDESSKEAMLKTGAFLASLGPLALVAAELPKLMSAIGASVKALASPLGLVSMGLAALGAVAMDDENAIGNTLESLADTLMDKLSGLGDYMADHQDEMQERLEGFAASMGTVASTLLTGLIDSLPTLANAGGQIVGAGFMVLEALAESIVGALANNSKSIVEAGALVLEALVDSLFAALPDFGIQLGRLTGDFIGYMFTAEGLTDIYNAGTTMIQLLLKGVADGWTGVIGFLSGLMDQILIQMGIVDPEARSAAREAGTNLANVMRTGLESGLADSMTGELAMQLMEWALYRGGGQFSGGKLTDVMMSSLNMAMEEAAQAASAEDFRNIFFENFLQTNALNQDLWRKLLDTDKADDALWDAVDELLEDYNDGIDYLRQNIQFEDLFPVEDDFWQQFYDAITSGNDTDLLDLMTSYGVLLFGKAAENVTEMETAAETAVREAMEKLGNQSQKAVAEMGQDVAEALDEASNSLAVGGYAADLSDGEKPAEEASLQLSDTVVKSFLLVMSKENGQEIGSEFLGGLLSGMEGQQESLVNGATAIASAAKNAVSGVLSFTMGRSIGESFGRGMATGLLGARSSLTSAAWHISQSTVDRFTEAFTAETQYPARQSAAAARLTGGSVNASFSQSQIQAIGSAVAGALDGAAVQMDRERVGVLVAPTVSAAIARDANGRRNGTV